MVSVFIAKYMVDFFLKLLEYLTLKRKEKLCFVRITKKEDRKVSRR
jgi:hypothetical protein